MIFEKGGKVMAVFVGNWRLGKRMDLKTPGRERKKKQDDRKKGLQYVREVREILESLSHRVEGPGYTIKWFYPKPKEWVPGEEKEKTRPIPTQTHTDYFGAFDLISVKDGEISCHQVSIIEEKSRKRWDILASGIPGYFWGRFKECGKVCYKVFRFYQDEEQEVSTYWLKEHRGNGRGTR